MTNIKDIPHVMNDDGEVAVVVSGGFGSGWATWNEEYFDTLAFHPDIVNCVLSGEFVNMRNVIAKLLGVYAAVDVYYPTLPSLDVVWVSPDGGFSIQEYDGSEYIAKSQFYYKGD